MNSSVQNSSSEEWLKVLSKGLVTIPKAWREELGIKSGGMVMAKKKGNQVIIESKKKYAPFRIYTDEEIDQFVKDDQLPTGFLKKIDAQLSKLR